MAGKRKTEKPKTEAKPKMAKTEKPTIQKRIPARLKVWKGTQADLSLFLGITENSVRDLRSKGVFAYDDDGQLDLAKCVSAYVKWLKDAPKRKPVKSGKSALDEELTIWKIEKAKMAIRDFRLQRYREVALAVLAALRKTAENLKQECKLVPRLTEAIDAFITAIGAVDVDSIAYSVEGEDSEDDDE
jgi:hypothetical protein